MKQILKQNIQWSDFNEYNSWWNGKIKNDGVKSFQLIEFSIKYLLAVKS